nr:MFS transporter [Bacilli bacterium]
MSTNAHAFTGDKVPKLTKILFPWSGIFRDACYALIGTFLVQYAMTSGVLDGAEFTAQYGVITTAMFIALIWDGFNDPIMGFILEKVHFKAGKFRPWIALGAIGNGLVVMAMFLCPMLFSGLRGWGYVAFMIVMYILWDTCFTMNDIGYWSMLPALTNDPKERATLTTHTAIAASVGTFLMNIIMFLAVGRGVSTMQVYAFAGLAVAGLFLISQLVVFFLCKEKERDAKQEEVSEQSSILDLFRVVIKNKELRVAAISMFLYYFASFILTGIGLNYFYMVYGYGGGKGGMVATMISVFYVLGTVVSQAFYPMLAKKLKKQTILLISTIVVL